MINKEGQDLISLWEDKKLTAYLCPAGVPTIGRGHTKGITHQMVKDKYTITFAEEQILFLSDLQEYEDGIKGGFERQPNENQLAAFVSMAFNIGVAGFLGSSALRSFNNYDDPACVRAMGLWVKITVTNRLTGKKEKVVKPGLVNRRAAEVMLFLTPTTASMYQPPNMPQKVEPPKEMHESNINRGAAVAGVSTALVAVTETLNQVNGMKVAVASLGDWFVPVVLVVALCAIGFIVYDRFRQRARGDA